MIYPQTKEEIDAEIARLTALREKVTAKADAWPKTVAYHLAGSKEDNWDKAKKLGLSKDAQSVFRFCCYEITLTLQVFEDGTAAATHLDGTPLAFPVPVATKV